MRTVRSLRTARSLLVGLVMAGGAVLAVPGTAHACSCIAAGPTQYLEWADAVVWAEVVESQQPSPPIGKARYLLEVDRVYKGQVSRSAQVDSEASSAACGLEGIESGRSYAFFLEGEGSPYFATLCGGTGSVPRAKLEQVVGVGDAVETDAAPGAGEQAVLTAGSSPEPGGPTRLPVSGWSWIGMGVGALAAAGGSVFWLWRRSAGRPEPT